MLRKFDRAGAVRSALQTAIMHKLIASGIGPENRSYRYQSTGALGVESKSPSVALGGSAAARLPESAPISVTSPLCPRMPITEKCSRFQWVVACEHKRFSVWPHEGRETRVPASSSSLRSRPAGCRRYPITSAAANCSAFHRIDRCVRAEPPRQHHLARLGQHRLV